MLHKFLHSSQLAIFDTGIVWQGPIFQKGCYLIFSLFYGVLIIWNSNWFKPLLLFPMLQLPVVSSLERRILEVNKKRVKVVKPGSKTSFPTTEVRGTYTPPFHVSLCATLCTPILVASVSGTIYYLFIYLFFCVEVSIHIFVWEITEFRNSLNWILGLCSIQISSVVKFSIFKSC